MLPKIHIILGLIFSAILFFFFPNLGWLGFSITFLSSVLIDIDHYIYYIFRKGNFNFFKAYNYFFETMQKGKNMPKKERKKYFYGFFIMHGIEFIIFLLLLSNLSHYFAYIAIGAGFHLVLDIIFSVIFIGRIDRLSIIYDYIKFKNSYYLKK